MELFALEVEQNIAIPEIQKDGSNTKNIKEILDYLIVGDSFFIPLQSRKTLSYYITMANTYADSINIKITSRTVVDPKQGKGVRIWRIA